MIRRANECRVGHYELIIRVSGKLPGGCGATYLFF
jgi:hypothetical protein